MDAAPGAQTRSSPDRTAARTAPMFSRPVCGARPRACSPLCGSQLILGSRAQDCRCLHHSQARGTSLPVGAPAPATGEPGSPVGKKAAQEGRAARPGARGRVGGLALEGWQPGSMRREVGLPRDSPEGPWTHWVGEAGEKPFSCISHWTLKPRRVGTEWTVLSPQAVQRPFNTQPEAQSSPWNQRASPCRGRGSGRWPFTRSRSVPCD